MKISVVFASPSTFNAGMQIVDKAWDYFAKRNNLNASYIKYRFDKISFDGGESSGFKCLTDHYEEMLSADRIIYWGDFLHMRHYHHRKANQLHKAGLFPEMKTALEFVERLLILKNESVQTKQKAISFGTNQMLDSTIDRIQEPGFSNVNSLIECARAWLPRDLYTSNYADVIRNGKGGHTQGVDCALLAWSNLFVNDSKSRNQNFENKKIGCFFGRSSSRYLKLSNFARRLADKEKAKLVWIPWIDKRGRNNSFKERIYKLRIHDKKGGQSLDFNDISWLRSFDFIITDTYHLAVNAWASGTPAICIADTISTQRGSGGKFAWNDKRHMFFQMSDALDFFVHGQELDSYSRRKDRLGHLQRSLNNDNLIQWINKKISMQAQIAEKRLLNAIE